MYYTCSAAGAMQKHWRRHTHLVSTLISRKKLLLTPVQTHYRCAYNTTDIRHGTHCTSVPQAWVGVVVLWWRSTRGRQTPHCTHWGNTPTQHTNTHTLNIAWLLFDCEEKQGRMAERSRASTDVSVFSVVCLSVLQASLTMSYFLSVVQWPSGFLFWGMTSANCKITSFDT